MGVTGERVTCVISEFTMFNNNKYKTKKKFQVDNMYGTYRLERA